MPSDPVVWIVLIVAAALVTALAVWKGRGLILRARGFAIEVKPPPPPSRASGPTITVANDARIVGSSTGDIAGVVVKGGTPPLASGTSVDVLRGGTVKDSKVGDIVGIKTEGQQASARDENEHRSG